MIRAARADDAAALADINRRGWLLAYAGIVDVDRMLAAACDLEQRWREGLSDPRDPRHVWVATATGGAVAGYVSVGPSRDADAPAGVGELRAIYVAPEAVGSGTGRALLARGERSLAADLGFVAATLWVFAANARARRFYERNGWTEEPGTAPGPYDWAPSLRYCKALAS